MKAIGLSGQMHGSVFLDKQQQVIRRALLWNDQRTAAECDEIERRAGGRSEADPAWSPIPALTGFTAPKILWLRNHEPKNFDKTVKVLLPKDEIRRRLTGEFATEVSDASGMLLLDVAKRNWSTKLLSASWSSIVDLLANCYESEEVTGKLTPEAAEAAGPFDRLRGRRRGGRLRGRRGGQRHRQPRRALDLDRHLRRDVRPQRRRCKIDPPGRLHTFCHAVHGKWHMMGVSLSAGGSLQWFRNAALPGRDRRGQEAEDRRLRHAHRRGRQDRRRAARGCSSCRTSPASARRTPIPTPAAASSA